MSFKADFEVGGKTYRVLRCSYSARQLVDATGRPSSGVSAGKITVEVEATSDSFLATWALSPFKVEDGKVTFFKRDNEQKMVEVSFKQGFLVDYLSEFDFMGESPMIERITISAMEISIDSSGGSVQFSNEWPD